MSEQVSSTPTAEADPVSRALRILADLPPEARQQISTDNDLSGTLDEVLRTLLVDAVYAMSGAEGEELDVVAGWAAAAALDFAKANGGATRSTKVIWPAPGRTEAPAAHPSGPSTAWVKELAATHPELLAKMVDGGDDELFNAALRAIPNTPEGFGLLVDTLRRAEALRAEA